MFSKAIVRKPAHNFADGLTTVDMGTPDFTKTLEQHRAYCEALKHCGLSLIELDADPDHPDSTFVEDVAILVEHQQAAALAGQAQVDVAAQRREHVRAGDDAGEAPVVVDQRERVDAAVEQRLDAVLQRRRRRHRQPWKAARLHARRRPASRRIHPG